MKGDSHNSLPADQPSIQIRILWAVITHALIFLAFLLLYGYASFRVRFTSEIQFWLVTLIVFLVLGAISFLFAWQIYLPVLKFLGAIQILGNGHNDQVPDLRKGSAIAPHLESMNSLLTRLKDSMDREYTAKILKQQAEIDALQSQINPHFLYNTLESIRGQAILEGVDEIADMIEALSALFRYSISRPGSIVTLEDELKNVDNYFAIQQYRFSDKFSLVKILDDCPDLLKYRLPKLTVQPIIENAIYHGLETKLGKGIITIRIIVTEKRLIIHIVDDGVGLEKTRLDAINERLSQKIDYSTENKAFQSGGIALFNVNQRIKLNFGEEFGLIVYSTPDLGTDVEIGLPLVMRQG
jgi:two-component system sensor histidine kinase YesM